MSLLKKSGASTRLINPKPSTGPHTRLLAGSSGDQDGVAPPKSTVRLPLPPEPPIPARPATMLTASPVVATVENRTVKLATSIPAPVTTKMDMEPDEVAALDVSTLPARTLLQERYLVEGVLGVGGMSVVYRGRDLRFKDVVRTCAIKEMFQSAPDSQTRLFTLKNFEREAGLLATLSHPAIPKVYDFFAENGKIYLIMELIAGRNLEAVLEGADQPIDEVRAGNWALQICDVLDYLHSNEPEPIIFRDLKPSNIILTPQERIVLIDFGIARLFQPDGKRGTMIGTEGYAPPEQYRGVGEPRVDIYALGATMHHLLTGSDPRSETPFTFHERPIRQCNPAVSPEMAAVIGRALEYNADARPTSAGAMKALLQAIPVLSASVLASAPSQTTAPSQVKKAGARLIWTYTCGDEVRSSPYVHNGSLYVGSYDTHLYCLQLASGELQWKRPTLGGISSSPTAWSELMLVGSEDGQLYALDARKGHPRWTFRTGRAVRSSPKVEDRIIYVGSDDQHVYAIDGLNGRKLWQYRTWMPVRSSCAIGEGVVYIGSSDGHVYALDAMSGGLRWKQKVQQGVISTPIINQGLIYVGSMDGHLYALDQEGGFPVWRFKTGHCVNGSPALAGNRIVFGGVDGNVYALEARSGKPAWKYEAGAQITSTPRVSDGSIYIGAVNGVLYKLDATSGSLVWQYTTDSPIVSSPAIANDVVFFGALDHNVYAIQA